MFRFLLLALAALLGLLVLADLGHRMVGRRVVPVSAAQARLVDSVVPSSATIPPRPALVVVDPAVADTATPAIDMLFRLAVRRRLSREGDRVYLDSLYPHTDSLLARWSDHPVITVALVADTALAGWTSQDLNDVRAAMRGWLDNAAALTLTETANPDSADVTIRWVDMLPIRGQTGSTTLAWTPDGVAHHATITLALRRNVDSLPIAPAQRTRIALHELGHALGLPHSGSSDDIMFPLSLVDAPSDRDQATLRLLYAVPPGPLRVQP